MMDSDYYRNSANEAEGNLFWVKPHVTTVNKPHFKTGFVNLGNAFYYGVCNRSYRLKNT